MQQTSGPRADGGRAATKDGVSQREAAQQPGRAERQERPRAAHERRHIASGTADDDERETDREASPAGDHQA